MPITFEPPTTRDTLLASLAQVDAQATALWRSFEPLEYFKRPADGGWSPAQNVAHLRRSTVPVIWALNTPRSLLTILFGRPRSASRSFEEVRVVYRQTLAAGAQAGLFGPPRQRPPRDPAWAQARSLDRWLRLIPRLAAAIGTWEESELDRYRVLHPLIGKLTVREMLHFTLYHLTHHSQIVAGRKERTAGA
jgi:hypothetical protein